MTRVGTMLLACLGLYPQVGSHFEMITINWCFQHFEMVTIGAFNIALFQYTAINTLLMGYGIVKVGLRSHDQKKISRLNSQRVQTRGWVACLGFGAVSQDTTGWLLPKSNQLFRIFTCPKTKTHKIHLAVEYLKVYPMSCVYFCPVQAFSPQLLHSIPKTESFAG